MKSMLILTDFSENAFRAAEYACAWTGPLQIERIVLFHAYQSFIGGTEMPVVMDGHQIYLDSLQELGLLHDRIKSMVDHGLTIELIVEDTILSDRINSLCKEKDIDMVVMGVTGKSGLEKLLVGSTTDQMIRIIKFPLLIVYNESAIGTKVKTIVLPLDLKEFPDNQTDHLLNILGSFNADLHLLNVRPQNESKPIAYPESFSKLHNLLSQYNPTFHFIEGEDITEQILDFCALHHASLIIMVHRKYDFFSELFHRSISKNLAHTAHFPILCLPDLD